ncbi:hypothetical protein Bpfe_009794, partial [Biomphalaria pfeifferi]
SPLDIQMESSSAQSALEFSYSLSHSQSTKQQELAHATCYGCCLTLKNFKDESNRPALPVYLTN